MTLEEMQTLAALHSHKLFIANNGDIVVWQPQGHIESARVSNHAELLALVLRVAEVSNGIAQDRADLARAYGAQRVSSYYHSDQQLASFIRAACASTRRYRK